MRGGGGEYKRAPYLREVYVRMALSYHIFLFAHDKMAYPGE